MSNQRQHKPEDVTDADAGLRSRDTEALGTDAYRDPQQEHPRSAEHKHYGSR
jgi:hypothetical protein